MIPIETPPIASSPVESPRFGRTRVWDPLPAYELFEVWITLATRREGVRVRALTADAATRLVLEHRPGWHWAHTTRWQGEGWGTT